MSIEVHYKCKCLSEERTVMVPARRADEEVVEWMHSCVEPSIYLDHRMTSPDCRQSTMEYAKIYIDPQGTMLGGQPKVN